ncbi:MAG: zf-HC2 domain-containing protein [Acidobacteriia bacterium]|nr:zf-HC2 domain-containing protein [Terriglobia bacterium]
MKTCERLRPLLSRFAEGEASPAEALGVARHIVGCTACKIVLARERRLHEALEGLRDPVSVDDEFSRLVMAALPASPPSKPSLARRRGLRLAGLLAVGVAGGALAVRLFGLATVPEPLRLVSRLDLDGGSQVLDGLARLACAAAALLCRIAAGVSPPMRPAGSGVHLAVPPILAGLALLTAGTFLAVTTWAVGRKPRGVRGPGRSERERESLRRH